MGLARGGRRHLHPHDHVAARPEDPREAPRSGHAAARHVSRRRGAQTAPPGPGHGDLHGSRQLGDAARSPPQPPSQQGPSRADRLSERGDGDDSVRLAAGPRPARAPERGLSPHQSALRVHAGPGRPESLERRRDRGPQVRHDGHDVLPRPRDLDRERRPRHARVAREALRPDVPQLDERHGVLPATAQPRHRARSADRALKSLWGQVFTDHRTNRFCEMVLPLCGGKVASGDLTPLWSEPALSGIRLRTVERITVDGRLAHAATIPSACYTDPSSLAAERDTIFARTWQLVGREEQVAVPGSYFTAEVAGEPLLVVRGTDGRVRALSNVCRHRAGPVARGEGTCRALRRGYHGWSYALDGRLMNTPEFDGVADFDRESVALPGLRVETWLGLG